MVKFPNPLEGTVFYDDDKCYACLAFHPIVKGHAIVAWKEDVEDLNRLNREDNRHFWDVVYKVRYALMSVYDVPKVYIAYLDEWGHVHAHMVPRTEGEQMGFPLLNRPHSELAGTDFSEEVETLQLFLGLGSLLD